MKVKVQKELMMRIITTDKNSCNKKQYRFSE